MAWTRSIDSRTQGAEHGLEPLRFDAFEQRAASGRIAVARGRLRTRG
jgi:hypothetical protein